VRDESQGNIDGSLKGVMHREGQRIGDTGLEQLANINIALAWIPTEADCSNRKLSEVIKCGHSA